MYLCLIIDFHHYYFFLSSYFFKLLYSLKSPLKSPLSLAIFRERLRAIIA